MSALDAWCRAACVGLAPAEIVEGALIASELGGARRGGSIHEFVGIRCVVVELVLAAVILHEELRRAAYRRVARRVVVGLIVGIAGHRGGAFVLDEYCVTPVLRRRFSQQ